MENEKAIALFVDLTGREYAVEGDPDAKEEPFITGFKEPSYSVSLVGALSGDFNNPAERDYTVEVSLTGSPFAPEGTAPIRALLDLADAAGVSIGFIDASTVLFS